MYGPEPTTLSSESSLFAGNTLWSTIGPAEVPSTNGHVWSFGFFSVNTTVSGPCAATLFMLPISDAGPFGLLIVRIRWKEKTTSAEVSGSPLENLRFGFSLQVYVDGVVNEQDCAASGCGALAPAGTLMRNW